MRIFTGKYGALNGYFEPYALEGKKEIEAKTRRINFRSSAPITTGEICSRPLQCTPLGMHWRHDWWQERHQEARERKRYFIPTTM